MSFAGFTLERLDANGELGLAPNAPVAVTIEATAAARGPLRVGDIRAVIEGTTAAHALRIDAAADDWSSTLAGSGGFDGNLWRGTVDRLEVDEQLLGPWRLESPTAVALGRGFATLANSCLLHVSNARWCTELDVRGSPNDRLVVSGQNFDLATLRPLLPPTVQLSGIYQFSGSLLDLMGEPRGALALTGGTTQARILFGEEQAFATELAQVQAGMTLTAGRAVLAATLRSTAGGSAELRAAIADVRARDSMIEGDLKVEWPDLGFLALLSPDLEQVSGALAVDLDIAGTLSEPTVDGRAGLSNGRISVPRWGLVVEAIEATALSRDGRALQIDATGRAGDGVLTLAGRTELDADAGWPTRLTLRGDAVRIVQRADAEVFATPDLTIDIALPAVTVTGSVHVPRASLEIVALPAQAVAPSPDTVVHGQTRTIRSQPLQLRTAIELTLGDDVRYSALNLDTTVGGGLRLATEPNASASATGTLRLDGTYDAYGQRLELERGQLLFSGPIDNPGLDVRAIRKLDPTATASATEVGVELTGTLRQPSTRIVSTPAMSEADALSYLLFGRPVTAGNGMGTDETTTLQTAALSLGLQQALPVVQRFGNNLGLDEFTVQSTTQDAGELMAGKYVSPKVFIRYSYGLFNRIGGLLLRFEVNDRLSIETRSGEANAVDFLFTVEKE
jgi:translocation and assembly module TamB